MQMADTRGWRCSAEQDRTGRVNMGPNSIQEKLGLDVVDYRKARLTLTYK